MCFNDKKNDDDQSEQSIDNRRSYTIQYFQLGYSDIMSRGLNYESCLYDKPQDENTWIRYSIFLPFVV